jgi:phosphatidylserine synthase
MKDVILFCTVTLTILFVGSLKVSSMKETNIEIKPSIAQQTASNVDPIVNQVEENQI